MLAAIVPVFFHEATRSESAFCEAHAKDDVSAFLKRGSKMLSPELRLLCKRVYIITIALGAATVAFMVQIMIPIYSILYFKATGFTVEDPEASPIFDASIFNQTGVPNTQDHAKSFKVDRILAWMFFFSMPYLLVVRI